METLKRTPSEQKAKEATVANVRQPVVKSQGPKPDQSSEARAVLDVNYICALTTITLVHVDG
jgi:hypothetical protein